MYRALQRLISRTVFNVNNFNLLSLTVEYNYKKYKIYKEEYERYNLRYKFNIYERFIKDYFPRPVVEPKYKDKVLELYNIDDNIYSNNLYHLLENDNVIYRAKIYHVVPYDDQIKRRSNLYNCIHNSNYKIYNQDILYHKYTICFRLVNIDHIILRHNKELTYKDIDENDLINYEDYKKIE